MVAAIEVVLAIAVVGLVIFFLRNRRKDQLSGMMQKRRATSKLVTSADYVEGLERMPVAVALTPDTFYYENPDLEASFDLNRLDEIEYDDELATGRSVLHQGERVLRLRSHGTTFEFILRAADVSQWQAALPGRRLGGPAAQRVAG